MITQQFDNHSRTAAGNQRSVGSRGRLGRDERDPADAETLVQMDLATLVRHCATESERFYRGLPHDTCYSYELFRRALVDRDEPAWEQLYLHYSGLVEGWIRRSGAFNSSGESSEYFVVGAFTKFWRAIGAERFTSFPTLASLLQYLQLCATSVVIDSVRAQSWSEMLPEETITSTHGPQTSPDEEAMNRVDRQEFWRFIDSQLNNDTERVVVYCSFVLGLTPRAIYARRSELFESVNDVYNVKRNVLGRLSRNTQLRQLIAL
ncbi:MAG: sigma-70 family RNA polymerase sigma factor [Oscillochloris sp.]|nr:sigma-70 family RNA polymerase sigma factor [Oscillochloris sp.]